MLQVRKYLVPLIQVYFYHKIQIKDTTGKDLPKGFQTAEFVLDHGFLDFISHRKDLKKKINLYLDLILNNPIRE